MIKCTLVLFEFGFSRSAMKCYIMIIDDRLKLVFIHIPKTGGTSIHQWLLQQNSGATALWGFDKSRGIDMAHLTLKQAIDTIPAFPIGHFKISVVRNPYDRLYSAYLQPYRQLHPGITFDRFLDSFVRRVSSDNPDPQLVHLWPMHRFVTMNGSNGADFILRMEHWERDVSFLRKLFDLRGSPPHLNAGKRIVNGTKTKTKITEAPAYLKYYNDRQIKMVNDIYNADFEWFSYMKS